MIKKSNLLYVLAFIFFLFSKASIAQENKGKQPLVQIFETLQDQHNIQFNYEKNSIETIAIIPPSSRLSLEETINYLNKVTDLTFVSQGNFILVNTAEFVICGYIKDFESQKTLSLATIQSESNSVVSDINGFFKISLKSKTEVIEIRYLGYKTLRISYSELAKENGCPTIFLESDFQTLSEVVLFNYITKGINKISNGSYEIDFSKFDILPGMIDTDVLQSVQAFPGINSSNETVSNINIRGGTHDQNLILWDNIKMYQSGHFFGLISMYNPQITQKVSLLKNGTDATLTDGVSGTISMATEQTLNTNFKGSFGANFIDVNGFVDIPINEKSSLQIAARKSINDFVETPTYSKFFERISQNTEVADNVDDIINSDEDFDFYDVSFRLLYKISEKDKLRVNFINVSNELIFNENAMVNGTEESRESSVAQNSIAAGINYNRQWNNTWQTTLEIFETDYTLKARNANILESQRFLQENIVSETSVKLITEYKLNETFKLKNGYHFVETKVTNLDDVDNPIFRLLVSEVVRTHALFSQVHNRSTNGKTNFNAGIRINYIDKFDKFLLEPRFNFSQNILDDFTLEIAGEQKHQNTSQVINFQNDFLGIEKRRWQLSNDKDIPIIKSTQASLGLGYSKNGWLVSAEGYYKTVDGITTQSQGFQNAYEFIKTHGSYDVVGLDVLIRKQLDKFNTWLSYAYMDNMYSFSTLPEQKFPSNFDITHALTFGTSYSFNDFKISAGLNWHSGKPITLPVNGNEVEGNSVNFQNANSKTLKDYFRIDASALYDFKFGKTTTAKAGLSLWNILDRKNEVNRFFRPEEGNIVERSQTSLGFTPNAVFRVFF